MWLFTTLGFFSVVQKTGSNYLTVRARARDDLDSLRKGYLPDLSETVANAGTDYRYRATVSHAAFSEALAKIVKNIGYGNFKDEVAQKQGDARATIYGKVWADLLALEDQPAIVPKQSQGKKLSCGGVIIDGQGKVLLVEPKDHFDGYVWTLPKDRPRPGESAVQAALRAVKEETGEMVETVREIPGLYAGGTTVNRYYLIAPGPMVMAFPKSKAIISRRWASYGDARALIRMTSNPVGLKRDLAVLDAGYLVWHRSRIEQQHQFESREPARQDAWKTLAMTGEIESIRVDRTFSEGEMDQIRRGHVPGAMEDKWFVFFKDNRLQACRSWTGATVFSGLFSGHAAKGWKIDSVQMPRDTLQNMGHEYAKELFLFLIDRLLLGTTGKLPAVPGAGDNPEAAALAAWHELGSEILKGEGRTG